MNSLKKKKPSKLIYFEWKFNTSLFLYMLYNKILWRLSLKTDLQDWAFCAV